jgi:hypothetical protein
MLLPSRPRNPLENREDRAMIHSLGRIGCLKAAIAAYVLVPLVVGCPGGEPTEEEIASTAYGSLEPFGSEDELDAHFDRVAALQDRSVTHASGGFGCAGLGARSGDLEYYSPAASEDGADADADPGSDEGITNNQESGVDEGDIVKVWGDYFVILRRGRLYSVRQTEGDEDSLVPVSRVDAYPPGSMRGSWYDEMLISDDRIVVVGYSYDVGATELGIFSIAEDGVISHRATHFLRSNDYYSSRNYASRLVDGQLIFYMPFYLSWGRERDLPSIRSWRGGDELGAWEEIIRAEEILRPIQPTLYPTLHTVVRCDLDEPSLACSATGVLGPYGRSFYVSREAVYLWVSPEYGHSTEDDLARRSVVYRMPLRGGEVTAARASGVPIDQFSFREEEDGTLDVAVTDDGWGDAMWAPELGSGAMALLRLPPSRFTAGAEVAPAESYAILPAVDDYSIVNRFVGDHLLYGAGSPWGYWGESPSSTLHVVPLRDPGRTVDLELGHSVDRIEVLGTGAVVVGSDASSLLFSSIDLEGEPEVASVFVRPGAAQGESRSHGFFYHSEEDGRGVLGLPVRLDGEAWAHLYYGSAEVQFLRVEADLSLHDLGALRANAEDVVDDSCVVSCVDWYGNARPIFYRDRTFALLGYELVEGAVVDEEMREVARVTYHLPAGER